MSTETSLDDLAPSMVYPVDPAAAPGLDQLPSEIDNFHRTHVQALSGMQKEAMVTNTVTDTTWRLASDEGAYLQGDDLAPSALGYMMAGMVGSYLNAIMAAATERDIHIDEIELVVDAFFSMTGSAHRGDMQGKAQNLEVQVTLAADAAPSASEDLVTAGIDRAVVTDLVESSLAGEFTLSLNGEYQEVEGLHQSEESFDTDPEGPFKIAPRPVSPHRPQVIRTTGQRTEILPNAPDSYTDSEGSSLETEQERDLHVRGRGTLEEDGLYSVEQKLYSPRGTVFEFLIDRAPALGGKGLAPDALTYISAGIGFGLVTGFSRTATLRNRELTTSRIVQDIIWSGRPTGRTESEEVVSLVTHVFLESTGDPSFATDILEFTAQTCFLHDLCRSELTTEISVHTS